MSASARTGWSAAGVHNHRAGRAQEGAGPAVSAAVDEGLAERVTWQRKGLSDLAPNQVEELKYAGRGRRLTRLPVRGLAREQYLHCDAAVRELISPECGP
jgi:hypothetical protein